jgi:hypothetical protein
MPTNRGRQFLVAVMVAMGSLVAPVAAGATARPAVCGSEGFYRSACAVIHNDTMGFAPGQDVASVHSGFVLEWNDFQEGNCSKCRSYHHTETIPPQSTGGASIANYGGVVSGAIGTISYRAESKHFKNQDGALTWWLSVPHSGSNSADCRTYLAQYFNCTEQWPSEEGPSKDAWWSWTVVDRPYALYVRNYTTSRLVSLGHISRTNVIDDIPGVHSLASVPAMSGANPGQAVDTGLLTMTPKKDAAFNFEYQLIDGPHQGSTVTIHLDVTQEEKPAQTDEGQPGPHTTGSYCNVSGVNTSSLNCEVKRFTPLPHGFNRFVVIVN